MSHLFKCGFCDFFLGLLRRVMCIRHRRGSTDSCYREIAGRNTVRMNTRFSSSSSTSEPTDTLRSSGTEDDGRSGRRTFQEELAQIFEEDLNLGSSFNHLLPLRISKRQGSPCRGQEPTKLNEEWYSRQAELLLSKSGIWEFDTFILDKATGGHCLPVLAFHLFNKYGLIEHFKLNPEHCWKLFHLIEQSYRGTNPYHNSIHATDVTQALHCFLQQPLLLRHLRKIEILAVLLAALTHDLDHPGFNKPYLIATKHPLVDIHDDYALGKRGKSSKAGVLLRSLFKGKKKEIEAQAEASILERHHWRAAYSCILQSKIFAHMPSRLPVIRDLLKNLILATDISRQEDYLTVFKNHVDRNNMDMSHAAHRLLVMQIALKTADISNPGRPWDISRKWSTKVCDEFFQQGDQERMMNIDITFLCDREKDNIPTIQAGKTNLAMPIFTDVSDRCYYVSVSGFCHYVVKPLYSEWGRFLQTDLTSKVLANLKFNTAEWNQAMPSLSDTNEITPANERHYSWSTSYSFSTECLLQEAGVRAPRVAPRRSSYSPARASKVKTALRRLSAPLQALVGAPRAISEVALRQELHAGWRPPPPRDYNPSVRKTPRRSAEEIRRSRLELAMVAATERSRSASRRGSRSASRRSSLSQERSSSPRPSPYHPAGSTPTRANIPPPVPELEVNGSFSSSAGYSAKNGDSTNGVEKFRISSFVKAECAENSDSCYTTSPSADRHLLSTVTGSMSSPSSESRMPISSDNGSAHNTGCSCKTAVQHATTCKNCCAAILASRIYDLPQRRTIVRRGSAPVLLAMPRAQPAYAEPKKPKDSYAEPKKLERANYVERKKLSASYATFKTIAVAPPIRRGSLPVEVMTGISAL